MQTFEQWWNEIEGYGLRAERFTTPDEAAKAAWDQAMSLRAQADARPVAWIEKTQLQQLQDDTADAWVYWREEAHVAEDDEIALYTHPEASAPGLSEARIRAVKDAVWAECEGFELMDKEARRILSALDSLTRTSAATVVNTCEEPCGDMKCAVQCKKGATVAEPSEPAHPDDEAVDRFAVAMKEKLAQAREKGRGGWQECDPVELSIMLREHVEKGDPRDVANFCMFLWNLGKPISDAALPYGKRAAQQQAEPTIDPNECAQDVYKDGQSIGLFEIPKDTANAICAGISAATGARVDWHYIAGRVHIKALKGTTVAGPSDSLKDSHAAVYEASQKLQSLAADLPDAWLRTEFVGIADQIANLCQIPDAQQQAEPGADERAAFEEYRSHLAEGFRPGPHSIAFDDFCAGYRAAQSGQRAGVAEGWKLVPAEATRQMAEAGVKEVYFLKGTHISIDDAMYIYRKFIAAAPTQQQEGGKE